MKTFLHTGFSFQTIEEARLKAIEWDIEKLRYTELLFAACSSGVVKRKLSRSFNICEPCLLPAFFSLMKYGRQESIGH